MAEVLGVFASSVQVAGLAAEIGGIGLKIRALYQEIQDAPEELAFRLQELHLLAGVLRQSKSASPDVEGFCERCLSELSLALIELDSQVKKSTGIRRKVASTKVVLKKQLIQKLDYRLCRSVQLLQLAANSHMASCYGLIIQNQDCMMSLLKTHVSQAQKLDGAISAATLTSGCTGPLSTKRRGIDPFVHSGTTICTEESKIWCSTRVINFMPRWNCTLGLPFITGTVHFKTPQNRDHEESSHGYGGIDTSVSEGLPAVYATFALPQWLSYKVLEMIAYRSCMGWKQYIRVRNIFPQLNAPDQTPLREACKNIATGEYNLLARQIGNREVTPWDEDSRGETMWATALYYSQWRICNLLMDLGAEPAPRLQLFNNSYWLVEDTVGGWIRRGVVPAATKRDAEAERRKLIERLDDNDGLRFSLLSGFEGSMDEFTSLKSSIWPDELFYGPELSEERMLFAISIACANTEAKEAPSMIRSVLGLGTPKLQSELDFFFGNSFGKTIFHGLAAKNATSTGYRNSAEWHRLTCDILSHVTDTLDLSQNTDITSTIGFNGIPSDKTPLMSLISKSISSEARLRWEETRRLRPLGAVISGCEKSILAWLEDLHRSGIDLVEYGSNERRFWRRPWAARPGKVEGITIPTIFSHPALHYMYEECDLVCSLELITFQYGSLPTDWKFWWDQPSDVFSGQFWHLVERESARAPMTVPGAWVD